MEQENYISWEKYVQVANKCCVPNEQIHQLTAFLSSTSTIIYFSYQSESNDNYIILNTMWLLDFFNAIFEENNVRSSSQAFIKRRYLLSQFTVDYNLYPPEIHDLLIDLLQKLDYKSNLLIFIPNLLKDTIPEIDQLFPRYPSPSEIEFQRVYDFTYVPLGFFQKLITRIYMLIPLDLHYISSTQVFIYDYEKNQILLITYLPRRIDQQCYRIKIQARTNITNDPAALQPHPIISMASSSSLARKPSCSVPLVPVFPSAGSVQRRTTGLSSSSGTVQRHRSPTGNNKKISDPLDMYMSSDPASPLKSSNAVSMNKSTQNTPSPRSVIHHSTPYYLSGARLFNFTTGNQLNSLSSSLFCRVIQIIDVEIESNYPRMKSTLTSWIICSHCLSSERYRLATHKFSYYECIDKIINSSSWNLFCSDIRSTNRNISLFTLAPDITLSNYQYLVIPSTKLEFIKNIGSGACGEVGLFHYYKYRKETSPPTKVAIKTLTNNNRDFIDEHDKNLSQARQFTEFKHEIYIMSYVSPFSLLLYPSSYIL